MKRFSIRRATKKDAPIIGKLIGGWLKWEIPRRESIVRAIEARELLVADWQNEVVGFIHCVMFEDIIDGGQNAFITAFYVSPKFRNRKIGSNLLQEAIKNALNEGVVGISASTANPSARRLYEKHNFKQFMGEWTMGEVFLEMDMNHPV
ncbi:MAG TPA: GNAT family N-acetyltransferase [Candidatus Bathyarchaeia archaeon]|nr:GNAT family N-acetyltransferase [Candidatus Bathyarchaeia archaeon]